MKKDVTNILYILMMVLVFGISTVFGQGNFFKYSTFYTSMTMNTPFSERGDYIAVSKGDRDWETLKPSLEYIVC